MWMHEVYPGRITWAGAWHVEVWAAKRKYDSGLVDDAIAPLSLTVPIIALAISSPTEHLLRYRHENRRMYKSGRAWSSYVSLENEERKRTPETEKRDVVPCVASSLSRSFP
jgi:hypothetical protein